MKRIHLAVGFALALASAIPSHAAVLFTEDWQSDSGGLSKTSLLNWNVLSGSNVDVGAFGCFDGSQCMDTQGSGGNPSGDIETKSSFLLLGGVLHTFSFDLANAGNSTFTITIGSVYSETFTPVVNGVITRTFTPVADTTATIRLTDLGPADNVGTYVDNFSLTSQDSGVPEPSSLVLIGMGLIGLSAVRRRVRR